MFWFQPEHLLHARFPSLLCLGCANWMCLLLLGLLADWLWNLDKHLAMPLGDSLLQNTAIQLSMCRSWFLFFWSMVWSSKGRRHQLDLPVRLPLVAPSSDLSLSILLSIQFMLCLFQSHWWKTFQSWRKQHISCIGSNANAQKKHSSLQMERNQVARILMLIMSAMQRACECDNWQSQCHLFWGFLSFHNSLCSWSQCLVRQWCFWSESSKQRWCCDLFCQPHHCHSCCKHTADTAAAAAATDMASAVVDWTKSLATRHQSVTWVCLKTGQNVCFQSKSACHHPFFWHFIWSTDKGPTVGLQQWEKKLHLCFTTVWNVCVMFLLFCGVEWQVDCLWHLPTTIDFLVNETNTKMPCVWMTGSINLQQGTVLAILITMTTACGNTCPTHFLAVGSSVVCHHLTKSVFAVAKFRNKCFFLVSRTVGNSGLHIVPKFACAVDRLSCCHCD